MNAIGSFPRACLAGLLLYLAVASGLHAGERLYVNRDGLQLLQQAMAGSSASGPALERGTKVTVTKRQSFWVEVKPEGAAPAGWAMQFDLVPTPPVGEVNRRAPKNGWQKWQQSVRRMDAQEGGSTAGSRGAGETSIAVGDVGKFKDVLPLVDAITAFEPEGDLDAFLREGELVPYIRSANGGGELE